MSINGRDSLVLFVCLKPQVTIVEMSIDPTNNHSINLDITPTQLAVGHKRHNGHSLVPG